LPRRCSTLYDDYLTTAETQRWILDAEVAWDRVDPERARTQPELLDQIRDAALIESFFPIYTTAVMRAAWDQIDVTAVFSIQLYESYKHFHALNRYLEVAGHRPIGEAEIVALRRRNAGFAVTDVIGELARYMVSEHFAAYFFLRLSRLAREPVLAELTGFIANDEFRHAQFASDLLAPRVRDAEAARRKVLETGLSFRHLGYEAIGGVPIAEKNDVGAILALNRRVKRLCGESLADFAGRSMGAEGAEAAETE
jgi:hypothetical protein